MNINITDEIITELDKKYEELEKQTELASEKMRTVKDQFGKRRIEVERDGKRVWLAESVLWTEVFLAGEDSQAGKILSEKYPDVFEAYKKQNQMAGEIQKYVMMNMHMDYKAMKLSDYIKLIDAIVKLRISQAK